ncbi:M23 family metallopeptidase [Aquibacillus saliphilus]|uniref:M23 family metallopeptidase n=1 Tax=Aquibacillus saliphilus TaxID=1909422 RepID=UPI001CEFBDC9|nr:M23 family metallopeptidase [Aquibacillus saliphilus]
MTKFPITSKFNADDSFRDHIHKGVDFAFPRDTELRSIMDGVVDRVIMVDNGTSWGKAVFVKFENGMTGIYAHMNKTIVHKGDSVEVGELLGYSGNTGATFGQNGGYHLHFGLKDINGDYINPEPYIPLIQNMDKLQEFSDNFQVGNFSKLDHTEIFNQAMDSFGNSLLDLKINMINLLPYIF